MSTFLLALISLPITASIASVLTLITLTPLEIRLQVSGSSQEEELESDAPGEKRHFVSLIFGVLATTFTKTCAILVAAVIFRWSSSSLSFVFAIVALSLFLFHDVVRIRRFIGNSGIWKEIGYLVGDIVGVTVGTWASWLWIT